MKSNWQCAGWGSLPSERTLSETCRELGVTANSDVAWKITDGLGIANVPGNGDSRGFKAIHSTPEVLGCDLLLLSRAHCNRNKKGKMHKLMKHLYTTCMLLECAASPLTRVMNDVASITRLGIYVSRNKAVYLMFVILLHLNEWGVDINLCGYFLWKYVYHYDFVTNLDNNNTS